MRRPAQAAQLPRALRAGPAAIPRRPHRSANRVAATSTSRQSTTAGSDPPDVLTPEVRVSARTEFLANRPISGDNVVPEEPALGLIAFSSPSDPEASLRIEDGRVVELDGKREAEFDMLDEFIAKHGIDLSVADEAMALGTLEFARMIVDPGIPRAEVVRLTAGMTPAKIAATLALLTPVEILQAIQKMRVRRTPSIQAHVTNRVDHPLLIAADAAAAIRSGSGSSRRPCRCCATPRRTRWRS